MRSPVRPFASSLSLFSLACVVCLALSSGRMAMAQTGSTGSANPTAVENKQPTLTMRWIISISDGYFPPIGDGQSSEPITQEPFLGEVRLLSYGGTVPNGWAECNGQILQINQHTALFALLGTTYGGDGKDTFALPNLRGYVPMGTGYDSGLEDVEAGYQFGSETHILNQDNLPAHTHSIPAGTTGSNGSGQPLENWQPSLGLTMGIVANGTDGGTGTVRFFAGNFYPAGFVACDGRALETTGDFAPLFAKLGYTFGGSGSTFNVPDLRGRIPIGKGQGDGLTNRTLGQQLGTQSITITESAMPSHTHTYPGGTTGAAGAGQPHSTMQPSLVLRPALALYGANDFFSSGPVIGEVRFFAYDGALPTGEFGDEFWVECDGSVHPVSDFNGEFDFFRYASRVSATYGGNGTTTVGLPDLRGRATAGVGNGRTLAQKFGQETVTLVSGNLPAHTHALVGLLTDMEITKKDSIDPVPVGDSFIYVLRVYNRGPHEAHNVVVTDPVPAGLTATGVSLHATSDYTGTGCTVASNTVVCALGTMRVFDNTFVGAIKKGKAHITVTVTATQAGQYTNEATVVAGEADTNTANNTGRQTTTVLGLSSVEVTPDSVPGGATCEKTVVKVTLSGVAPFDTFVALSDNLAATTNVPDALSPFMLRIPQGQSSATLTVEAAQISAAQAGQVKAAYGTQSLLGALTIRPIGVRSVSVTPDSLMGGGQSSGTVKLECAADASGVSVTLKTGKAAVAKFINPQTSAEVHPLVLLLTSTNQTTFTVQTYTVAEDTAVNLTAEAGGVTRSARLDVLTSP